MPETGLKLEGLPGGYDPEATATEDHWFDEDAAIRAIEFFPKFLRHGKGKFNGHPFELEPWQKAIIGNLFGWKRRDGSRRYRTSYMEIPRKNGKSHLAAGLALYLLTADGEAGAEVYGAASDRDQAGIVFQVAKGFVQSDDILDKRCTLYRNSIMVDSTKSTYRCIAADAHSAHGFNAHGIIFDELHTQKNRDLWDTLVTSTGARRQPLVIGITTAGFDQTTICYEIHKYAEQVRDGIVEDPAFLPVIYAAATEDEWDDPKTWAKANPNMGVSISEEFIERECKRAKDVPGFRNTFLRLYLNRWTEQADRWISMERWDDCTRDGDLDIELEDGLPCWIGIDLSERHDLTAVVLVVRMEDDRYAVVTNTFLPHERLFIRAREDHVPYDVWFDDGDMFTTPGETIAHETIVQTVLDACTRFSVQQVAIDPWNAKLVAKRLEDEGVPVAAVPQAFRTMTEPSHYLEALVTEGRLCHFDHPVLRWCASNVAIETDSNENIRPSKKHSLQRIDPIVALVMALGRAMLDDDGREGSGRSVYDDEEQGLKIL